MTNLKQTISNLQDTFTKNPKSAIAFYHSSSELKEGFKSNVKLRHHKLIVDEPTSIGGKDEGASPVELILAALATCQEISYKAYATALDIPLEKVSVKLTGELNLRGFLGIDKNTRPGYQNIKGSVDLVSSASSEQLEKLKDIVDQHCPVLDILTNGVQVSIELEKNRLKKSA